MYARYCLLPVNTWQNPESCSTEQNGECEVMYAYILVSNPFWCGITKCLLDTRAEVWINTIGILYHLGTMGRTSGIDRSVNLQRHNSLVYKLPIILRWHISNGIWHTGLAPCQRSIGNLYKTLVWPGDTYEMTDDIRDLCFFRENYWQLVYKTIMPL